MPPPASEPGQAEQTKQAPQAGIASVICFFSGY
jgi:hypothetical protein